MKMYCSADGGEELIATQAVILEEICICHACERPLTEGAAAVDLTAWDGTVYTICPKCEKRRVMEG